MEFLELEAKIQSRIGEFLGLKTKILQMTKSVDYKINKVANELLTEQLRLEVLLNTNLDMIEANKKTGSDLSSTQIMNLLVFYKDLDSHIRKTNTFIGSDGQSTGEIPVWLYVVGAGVAIYLLTQGRKK